MDNGGRYFYIKDGDTVWNPGWKPCKTPLDGYECRHGMNYTRITGSKNGVEASVLFFVPLHTWAEVQKMTLKNQSRRRRPSRCSPLPNGACGMQPPIWIGRADWNDCLNLNCFSWDPNESFQTTENKGEGSKAESLMIAGLFVVTGKDYVALCKQLAKEAANSSEGTIAGLAENDYLAEANRMQQAVDQMSEAVKQHGWDGEWFLRAYDFFGNKIGSDENEEGKIFIESQGWCTMAGIGLEDGLSDKALDSAKERLECEHGMVLNNPAYTTYHVEMGEISSYPEGYKENAGIFCHNNPWVIIGETVAGRGNDAWNHYTKILPSYVEEKYQTLHKVEPYVNCQMVAGKDAARPGEGKNSWLTGTAAWMWYTVSEFILGIKPDYEGLLIDPCLPSTAKEYEVVRKFRGGEYHIVIKNPDGKEKGVSRITVDGKLISGTIVPCSPGKHEVHVEM